MPWYARVARFARENFERLLAVLGFFGVGSLASLLNHLTFLNFVNVWIWNKGKLVLISGSFLAVTSFALAWWLHSSHRDRLESALHDFAHKTRDDFLRFYDATDSDAPGIHLAFTHMLSRIAATFRIAMRAPDLEAVLWIANDPSQKRYFAFAKTSGIDYDVFRPIEDDSPLVLVLRDCKLRGVIHIPDASKLDEDENLRTISTYIGSPGCAAIIPINIWEGNAKCLAGLLMVMAKKSFHLRHVELLMACADILGMAYKSLELTRRGTRTTDAPGAASAN